MKIISLIQLYLIPGLVYVTIFAYLSSKKISVKGAMFYGFLIGFSLVRLLQISNGAFLHIAELEELWSLFLFSNIIASALAAVVLLFCRMTKSKKEFNIK